MNQETYKRTMAFYLNAIVENFEPLAAVQVIKTYLSIGTELRELADEIYHFGKVTRVLETLARRS